MLRPYQQRAIDQLLTIRFENTYNQNMKNEYYVYVHKRNDNGEVFYVGKGCGRRAFGKNGRNRHWHNVVNKYGYEIEIIKGCLTEEEAFAFEKDTIAYYGRKNLCNYTDGGDGPSGAKKTQFQKEHMRKKMIGRVFSDETIQKMSIAATIRNANPEWQAKRKAKLIGRKHSEEHKEKIRIAGIGRKLDANTRKKISDFHKGKKKKPEAVKAMAASKSKIVLCVNNGIIYESMSEAARQLKLKQSHISNVAHGKANQTKGYIFKFIKND